MNIDEIHNLKERFKVLELANQLDGKGFEKALFEYGSYICASKLFSKHIHDMALEQDVDREALYGLFLFGTLRNSFRNKRRGNDDLGFPLFMDKEIEGIYGLAARFIKMLNTEESILKVSEKDNISTLDLALSKENEMPKYEGQEGQEIFLKFFLLHNNLLERLQNDTPKYTEFNEQNGLLTLGTFKIQFRKFTEQYHCLKELFKDKDGLGEDLFFSEMAKEIDSEKTFKKKDFHNYFSAIKRHILSKTGIDDFLVTTSQSVSINRKYLK